MEYGGTRKFFYGAVFLVNGIHYFVPVTSYKKKQQDLILITDKSGDVKGSLRFTFMIPIPKSCLCKLDIAQIENENYRVKVSKELAFCRRNRDKIIKQAMSTYKALTRGEPGRYCCDFKLLEQACLAYCQQHGYEIPSQAQATERKYFYFELTHRQLDALKKEGILCEYTQKDTRLIVRVPKEFEEQARMVISGITAGLK